MAKPRIDYELGIDDRTRRDLARVDKRFQDLAKTAGRSFGIAAGATITAITALTVQATKSADQIGKLSTQLGIAEKDLSALKFIAGQTGVEFNTFTQALQRSRRRIAEAAQGTGEAVKALDELNISAQDLNQLDPAQQFEVLSKALADVDNNADQVRLAFKLFDSEGVRLLRTINATSGSFDALTQQASELGVVIDQELTDKAANLNDAWDRLKNAAAGVGNALLNTVAEPVSRLADAFTGAIVGARKLLEQLGLLRAVEDQRRLVQVRERLNELARQELQIMIALRDTVGGRNAAGREEQLNNIQAEKNLLLQETLDLTKAIKEAETGGGGGGGSVALGGGTNANNGSGPTFPAAQIGFLNEDEFDRDDQLIEQYEREEALAQQHLSRLYDIENQWKLRLLALDRATGKERVKLGVQTFSQLTAGAASLNKTFFNINKIAAISEALINAKAAVVGAYRYGNNIGGPIVGAAFAATAAATTAAQIQSIRSQQFNGGGGVSASGSSSSGLTSQVSQTNVIEDSVNLDSGSGGANVINIDFGNTAGFVDPQNVRDFIADDLIPALEDVTGQSISVVGV